MATLEEKINALEDREAIRELTAEYCHSIAAGDGTAVTALFCDDGAFVMGERRVDGSAELSSFYAALSDNPPIPFIQNHVIDSLTPTKAQGRCSVEIRMVRDGTAITAAGWYRDTYKKIDGTWKFSERVFITFHMVPLTQGWGN
ncbi:MAG: nuclear transport factor 2 family protein [Pseudomonadaceae bacterium]|nr:nuclear transport factor 2 family protein [Pseudomonadaceae bacterium]